MRVKFYAFILHFLRKKVKTFLVLDDGEGLAVYYVTTLYTAVARLNIYNLIPLFLWHERRKEKAWQKESAVIMGLLAPNPSKLLKKLDQNFQTWVRCEHCAFDR